MNYIAGKKACISIRSPGVLSPSWVILFAFLSFFFFLFIFFLIFALLYFFIYLFIYFIFWGVLICHCVKSFQVRSYFWSVFSCIRTEYGKIRTRKNFVFAHFSRSVCNLNYINILALALSFRWMEVSRFCLNV